MSAHRDSRPLADHHPIATPTAVQIVKPEPPSKLLDYYEKAQKSTGIAWQVLAAINLVKSNMGRIAGAATRLGATGPMQMTSIMWDEAAGKGDITSAHDSIQAAARYLLRKGSGANGDSPESNREGHATPSIAYYLCPSRWRAGLWFSAAADVTATCLRSPRLSSASTCASGRTMSV